MITTRCCVLRFKTVCLATDITDVFSTSLSMLSWFSQNFWEFLTLYSGFGLVRIATARKCHCIAFLSERKTSRLKRPMKAVPSSILKASFYAMPNQTCVHRSPRRRCNIMSPWIRNACFVAFWCLGGACFGTLFFYLGEISAEWMRMIPAPVAGKVTAVCIAITNLP